MTTFAGPFRFSQVFHARKVSWRAMRTLADATKKNLSTHLSAFRKFYTILSPSLSSLSLSRETKLNWLQKRAAARHRMSSLPFADKCVHILLFKKTFIEMCVCAVCRSIGGAKCNYLTTLSHGKCATPQYPCRKSVAPA